MGDTPKRHIDWELIERDYRAGIKTLRQIAEEHGITHGAVNKRAKAEGWERDLQKRILEKAEAKVSRAQVSSEVSKESKVSDRALVEANAEVIAQADLLNRKHVVMGIDTSIAQLQELELLGRPDFQDLLEEVGNAMRKENSMGVDKMNDLYRYVISLAGRVKMAKDISASLGVYIPMQRKILKLDQEANSNQAAVDEILRKINSESS